MEMRLRKLMEARLEGGGGGEGRDILDGGGTEARGESGSLSTERGVLITRACSGSGNCCVGTAGLLLLS